MKSRLLIKGETAEQYIVDSMTSLGLTVANREQRNNETCLTFSEGSAVRIGRYITFTDPDGKNLPDCILPQQLAQMLPVDTIRTRAHLAALPSRVDEAMFKSQSLVLRLFQGISNDMRCFKRQ